MTGTVYSVDGAPLKGTVTITGQDSYADLEGYGVDLETSDGQLPIGMLITVESFGVRLLWPNGGSVGHVVPADASIPIRGALAVRAAQFANATPGSNFTMRVTLFY